MNANAAAGPRILLFTGDGKGKTTAALGLALRAAGHDMAVAIVQFLKNDATVGEAAALGQLPQVSLLQAGLGFVPSADSPAFARHRAAAEDGLKAAVERIASGRYTVVVLDEICIAVAKGLLKENDVIDAVKMARPGMCVVLTGRGASAGLIALADTVTEMRCVKHAFEVGRPAEDGVER